MLTPRTAAASAALALFMLTAAPVPQLLGPAPAAAQTADQLLSDQTAVSSMDNKALHERIKALKSAIDGGTLSGAQKKQARTRMKEARAELKSRREAKQADQGNQQNQQKDAQQVQAGAKDQGLPPELAAAMNDQRPLGDLSDADLHGRMKMGREAIKSGNLSGAQKKQVRQFIVGARDELKNRRDTKKEPAAEMKSKDTKAPATMDNADAGKVLSDKRPAASLSDKELRARLQATRSQLGDKQTPPDTVKALRAMLVEDRKELRGRVAEENAKQSTKASNETAVDNQTSFKNSDNNVVNNQTTIINNNTTVNQIVQRQTPSDKLSERDLNRRIRMLERARRENTLRGPDLEIAGRLIIADRLALRVRLTSDRHRRVEWIQQHRSGFHLNINVGAPLRFDIAAAEVGPIQIQEQLVAAPRWKPKRAYSYDEIIRDDNVRRAMPGIEIDTITFETGSAELAPEMVNQLEDVASVMEKILAVRPKEVFLIEGHTDAVGSPESNQALSEARAESVKQVLVEYFAIDPQNLRTVGLGERFLKIATDGPEQENRRVTIRRITPMLTGEVN